MVRFREILKLLSEQKLDYVVIGGVAASLHGSPVATLDVDVCIAFSADTAPRILAALRPIHPTLRTHPNRVPLPDDLQLIATCKNLYLSTDLGRIDLLGELPGICTYEELSGKTELMDVGGFTCRVLDIDTLIASKRVANREKDHVAIRHLEAIKEMKRQNPGLFDKPQ